jgi:hypothetical protein
MNNRLKLTGNDLFSSVKPVNRFQTVDYLYSKIPYVPKKECFLVVRIRLKD